MLFVNGVNVGRYWDIGPQRTLYIPAPILRKGINKVSTSCIMTLINFIFSLAANGV